MKIQSPQDVAKHTRLVRPLLPWEETIVSRIQTQERRKKMEHTKMEIQSQVVINAVHTVFADAKTEEETHEFLLDLPDRAGVTDRKLSVSFQHSADEPLQVRFKVSLNQADDSLFKHQLCVCNVPLGLYRSVVFRPDQPAETDWHSVSEALDYCLRTEHPKEALQHAVKISMDNDEFEFAGELIQAFQLHS